MIIFLALVVLCYQLQYSILFGSIQRKAEYKELA